jgi:hypothetical protein
MGPVVEHCTSNASGTFCRSACFHWKLHATVPRHYTKVTNVVTAVIIMMLLVAWSNQQAYRVS